VRQCPIAGDATVLRYALTVSQTVNICLLRHDSDADQQNTEYIATSWAEIVLRLTLKLCCLRAELVRDCWLDSRDKMTLLALGAGSGKRSASWKLSLFSSLLPLFSFTFYSFFPFLSSLSRLPVLFSFPCPRGLLPQIQLVGAVISPVSRGRAWRTNGFWCILSWKSCWPW